MEYCYVIYGGAVGSYFCVQEHGFVYFQNIASLPLLTSSWPIFIPSTNSSATVRQGL